MHRRRFVAVASAVLASTALLVGGGYSAFALLAPLDAVSPVVQPLGSVSTPEASVDLPGYGGWAIGDADSEAIYASRGIDEVRPIASIAKVVTALVVLHEHPIAEGESGETITLTASDAALVGRYQSINGTTAPARAGQTITQRQIIELMMVHSANNYAETLAVWAFGSVNAYVEAANAWIAAQGIDGLTIADTTGFSTSNAGSPRALLQLAQIAVDDPVVSAASALPSVTVAGVGTFTNRNLALGESGVTGLKTGTLRVAGSSLLFSAERTIDGAVDALPESDGTVGLVGVALGGPDHPTIANDLDDLLDSVVDDFHVITLGEPGAVIARYETEWGDVAELVVSESEQRLVWGEMTTVSFAPAPVLQPGLEMPAPGEVVVRWADDAVTLDLHWNGSLEGPPVEWRLAQPLESLGVVATTDRE